MGEILSKIIWVLGLLMPPRMSQNGDLTLAERAQLYAYHGNRWRWVVFSTLTVLMLVTTANIALSWGYEPYFHGFVRQTSYASQQAESRSALVETQSHLHSIELHQLEESLVAARIGQCKSSDKRYYAYRLKELRAQYEALTQQEWPIPECKEVTSDE